MKNLIRIVEWVFKPSKYSGRQGKQEKERRIRQAKRGILKGFTLNEGLEEKGC